MQFIVLCAGQFILARNRNCSLYVWPKNAQFLQHHTESAIHSICFSFKSNVM